MKKIIGLILAMSMLAVFAVGCSTDKGGKVVDLKEIHKAVKESLGDEYAPNFELDAATIEAIYGLNPSDIEEFIAETPMISTNIDTFIAIKAKEGKADLIEEGLKAYRNNLVEDSMQYPMNLAKVNASKVVRNGDYVFFLMLGRYDARDEATEEERMEFAENDIKEIENVINKFFE